MDASAKTQSMAVRPSTTERLDFIETREGLCRDRTSARTTGFAAARVSTIARSLPAGRDASLRHHAPAALEPPEPKK
jgi:hypothetical protein